MCDSSSSNSKTYKWCFVPLCTNTKFTTPDKLFMTVPKDEKKRRKWFTLAHREFNVSPSSTLYCCEDHFNKTEDIQNLLQYQMMGGNVQLRLKPSAVPHKFLCQGRGGKCPSPSSEALLKERQELVAAALNENQPEIKIEFDPDHTDGLCEASCDRAVQCNASISSVTSQTTRAPYRSKSTQCKIMQHVAMFANTEISIFKDKKHDIAISVSPVKCKMNLQQMLGFDAVSDFEMDTSTDNDDFEEQTKDQSLCLRSTMKLINSHIEVYLGINEKWSFVIDHVKAPKRDIYLTLMKIKLDDSFERLGHQFGVSETVALRVFTKTVFLLSHYFKTFIYRPSRLLINKNLPISFRYHYTNVESIIFCYEIEIENPSDPIPQDLTWSKYKKSNTVKYLISSTPDGFITFVSKGYGGQTNDCVLVEDSQFLQEFSDSVLMADRAFRTITPLLPSYKCTLIRLPSVFKRKKPTMKIASMRIHIERIFQRIREFALLDKHSVIDLSILRFIDEAILIACGLINLQNPLTEHLYSSEI